MSRAYHLAQINIGRLLAPLDDPVMADFVANLDPINALADKAPGFVWRFQTEEGNATAVRPYEDDRIAINFSVWTDLESLRNYVFRSPHAEVMRRRREWFERLTDVYVALWWVPAGHQPTVAEAVAKLEHLRQNGPSPDVFTFREVFPPPDASGDESVRPVEDACPA
ncbi:MAG TPA: DUF3291 domain-containing protein [Terriglobales bacterium]|nr:DUF3291 domain-containing protein [Terriglobales bacterium]